MPYIISGCRIYYICRNTIIINFYIYFIIIYHKISINTRAYIAIAFFSAIATKNSY